MSIHKLFKVSCSRVYGIQRQQFVKIQRNTCTAGGIWQNKEMAPFFIICTKKIYSHASETFFNDLNRVPIKLKILFFQFDTYYLLVIDIFFSFIFARRLCVTLYSSPMLRDEVPDRRLRIKDVSFSCPIKGYIYKVYMMKKHGVNARI